jgi:hypothetical protein
VIAPDEMIEVFVKLILVFTQADGGLNEILGSGCTTTVRVVLEEQPRLEVTESVTVKTVGVV